MLTSLLGYVDKLGRACARLWPARRTRLVWELSPGTAVSRGVAFGMDSPILSTAVAGVPAMPAPGASALAAWAPKLASTFGTGGTRLSSRAGGSWKPSRPATRTSLPPTGRRVAPPSLADAPLPPIRERYFLCVCVKTSIDREGRRWTDELWAKDLAIHMEYLKDLVLAAPAIRREPKPTDVCLDSPQFDGLTIVDLPAIDSYAQAIKRLPAFAWRLWKGMAGATVVHTGFGCWPIAEGWFVAAFGRLRKQIVLTNVESSFWRSPAGAPLHKRIRSWAMEVLCRASVRMADLRFFTSQAYAREFLPKSAPGQHVTPATWIDESWILSDRQRDSIWDRKSGPVRLLFPARLLAEKGVEVLLRAIDEARDAELEISIIGNGDLAEQCRAFAQAHHGNVKVRFLDPVPYGEPFLGLLREHDAVLVPSISAEQPRIVFDAFSQGVPVIGSATTGLCEVVRDGMTGRLVPPGDVGFLAAALRWASRNRPLMREFGSNALIEARGKTHNAMHRTRQMVLLEALSARTVKTEARPRSAGERLETSLV